MGAPASIRGSRTRAAGIFACVLRLALVCALALAGCGGQSTADPEQHGKPLTTGTHTGAVDTATTP